MTTTTIDTSGSIDSDHPSFRHHVRPGWTAGAFALLAAAVMVASRTHHNPWLVAIGIVGPDLSFLTAIGATPDQPGLLARRAVRPYNIVHTPATPALVLTVALITSSSTVAIVAIAWLSHIAWDRGVGYRLRNPDGSIQP